MLHLNALIVVVWGILIASFTSANAQTESFTYYPPGSIQSKTGAEEQLSTGYADYNVRAPEIGFPLVVPAFANSQYYLPGGNGYTGSITEKQCFLGNYSYPWRDDYCESRLGSNRVNEFCPGGFGHQGQDIRPRTCIVDWHEVLAVEDGFVSEGGDKDDPNKPIVGELIVMSHDRERLYDYLHMETFRYKRTSSGKLVLDGNGKPVEEPGTRLTFKKMDPIKRGQVIGYVSSILGGIKDNTTRHLHFGLRKRKRNAKGEFLSGGKYFYHSPYMSLVRAYEAAIGKEGIMLPAPQVCQPNTARCTTKSIITCNDDGIAESLTPCTTAGCKKDVVCTTGVVQPPPDMSLPTIFQDMSRAQDAAPPDLSTTCDPRACLCGCNGSSCRFQICTPNTSYCTTATTLIECSRDGCSTTTRSCGYGCSGNRCNDPPGTVDMSMPPPRDMVSPPPGVEVCNGLDDDGNGIIDDPSSCWQWVTRFKDPITQARCYGIGSIPPFACTTYEREFVLFAVPTTLWSDGTNSLYVQCSRGIDHVLTKYASTERTTLETLGWNCSLQLGYFFNLNQGPRFPKRTPHTYTCPLYRQKFITSGSQSHFYSPFNESVPSATCEPPARADVLTGNVCGVAVGC